MTHPNYVPLIEITRGSIVESIHFGAIAVSDNTGNLLATCGDPYTVTYLRSSAKPFQALPMVEAGGDTTYDLSPSELALICASHSGTDEQVEKVRSIQKKVGVTESDLLCGVHEPYDEETARALRARGEAPSPNRHNCSGKHTGMLAFARLGGWPVKNYVELQHPVQQAILMTFAEMAGLPPEQVVVGVDGCSAPNFAVPLANAARAYANVIDPRNLSAKRAAACQRITRAMTRHPEMVAGPGRFDTRLMEATGGRILCKSGAEGYLGMALEPEALGPRTPAVGIAIKIADGDLTGRALRCVALEVLQQLGAITPQELEDLVDFCNQPLYNQRRILVGQVQPHFELTKDERYFGA